MGLFNANFFRKRWLDFRNGHSIYLAFVLTFVNFILITYNFAVKQIHFIDTVFGGGLVTFTLVFIFIYIPAAMLIGYWHRRQQYRVENETLLAENWIWAWMTRYQILLIEGKTTPEENKEVLNYLENILRRHKMEQFIRPTQVKDRIDGLIVKKAQSSEVNSTGSTTEDKDANKALKQN